MKAQGRIELEVKSPSVGLVTQAPASIVDDQTANRGMVVAKNVRFDGGVVRSAPGYESVTLDPVLTEILFIDNTDLVGDQYDGVLDVPVIGDATKLYAVIRSQETP